MIPCTINPGLDLQDVLDSFSAPPLCGLQSSNWLWKDPITFRSVPFDTSIDDEIQIRMLEIN